MLQFRDQMIDWPVFKRRPAPYVPDKHKGQLFERQLSNLWFTLTKVSVSVVNKSSFHCYFQVIYSLKSVGVRIMDKTNLFEPTSLVIKLNSKLTLVLV